MRLGTLFKRSLYRDLRNSIGYYDARRIIRRIEIEKNRIDDPEDIKEILNEMELDKRQTRLTMETVNRYSYFLTDKLTQQTSARAPVTTIREKKRGLTWLKEGDAPTQKRENSVKAKHRDFKSKRKAKKKG